MQRQEFYGLGMQIDEHLDRPGLSPALRVLVAVAATTWRADWSRLKDWTTRAAALEHDRAGFEEALRAAMAAAIPSEAAADRARKERGGARSVGVET